MLIFSSCGHQIHQGKIIQKYYEPSRWYTYTTMMSCGKTLIPQVHTVYDDEDWIIVVQNVEKNNIITENFYIDESNWKCLNVGDNFNDSIPCTIDDNNKTIKQ